MFPQKCQLLEFRCRCIKLFLVQSGEVDLCYEAPIPSNADVDTSLIEWFQHLDLNLIPFRNLPLVVSAPSSFFAIKIVSIPSQSHEYVDRLLSYEFNSMCTQLDGPFVWSRIQLVGDDVEQSYLVSILSELEYQSCQSMFSDRAISLVGMVPLYLIDFLVFQCELKKEPLMVTRFIHIEENRLILFGAGSFHSCLRNVRSPQGIDFEDLMEGNKNFQFFLKEWKRFSATLDRSIGQFEYGLIILNHLNPSSCRLIDSFSEEFKGACSDIQEMVSFGERCGEEDFFDQIVSSEERFALGRRSSERIVFSHNRWLVASVAVCALLPFPIILGNVGKIHHYSRDMVRMEEQLRIHERNRSIVDDLSNGILIEIKAFDGITTALLSQQAWAQFMESMECAMNGVGDVWLDTFDYSPEVSMTEDPQVFLEGRFLIRQRNLTDLNRDLVISGIEKKLTQLIETLVLSEHVTSVSDLKVNFSGVDRGINVVPFSLRLLVSSDLSGNVLGGFLE